VAGKKTEGRKKDSLPANDTPADLKTILKDDVIGVSDFKRTKVGSLTGFSAAARAVGTVKGQVEDSLSRTQGLFKSLTAAENVPALPDDGGDAAERFAASMRLHGRSDRDLEVIVRNSCRSAWLYIGLGAVACAFSAWSMVAHPPASFVDSMARLGPLPLVVALALKHSYTNWIVRRRRLDGFGAFLKSGEWLPEMP